MSERVEALRSAIEKRLGEKASRHASSILIDLMISGYTLVELHEIPSSLRDDGLLVKIAAELESVATGAATAAAFSHHEQLADVSHNPPELSND